MRIRDKKHTDQDNTIKAYELLMDLIISKQEDIEPALWIGAMICSLADNFEKSQIPFDEFKKTMIEGIDHYKY